MRPCLTRLNNMQTVPKKQNRIRAYYDLAKPGIIYGNAITAIAAFFFASDGHPQWWLFLAMMVGLSLVIGGSCVFNNFIDRDIDKDMTRTSERSTVTGDISGTSALVYGAILLLAGITVLCLYTNAVALLAAIAGVVFYVMVYTPLKRRTVYSTLIGSISGATPPVVGYAAVTHAFDLQALILFLILVFWQMPHFYGIALYRLKEYGKASRTKVEMIAYAFAFLIASISLSMLGYAGYVYFTVSLILGIIWLWLGFQGFKRRVDDPEDNSGDNSKWGRKMFLFSLIVITVWSLALGLNPLLI